MDPDGNRIQNCYTPTGSITTVYLCVCVCVCVCVCDVLLGNRNWSDSTLLV